MAIPWRPLLEGDLRAAALATVEEIAESLRADTRSGTEADRALFFGYLHRAFPERGHDRIAMEWMDRAIDRMSQTMMAPSLHGGFTGIAWVAAHLQNGMDEDDPNSEIDAALAEYVRRSPWTDPYDLIAGLVGIGVYFLERLPRPSAVVGLNSIIDRLVELSEHQDAGITWKTPLHHLPEWQRRECPEGYYNLGLAHGVPGILGLLGKSLPVAPNARTLLDGAVSWLLAQDSESGFSGWIVPGHPTSPSRAVWCYGDLGVAAALHLAGETAWQRIARRTLGCEPGNSGIRDAGICHGACGVAHIYNRFTHAAGDEAFAAAARILFKRALEMKTPGQGIAGFAPYDPQGSDESKRDASLVTGAAGIGLTLLAAITPVEPTWDRILLIS